MLSAGGSGSGSCANRKGNGHDDNEDEDGGDSALGESLSCLVLYTAYERMALERIVGPKRCAHMLAASKNTFMFC